MAGFRLISDTTGSPMVIRKYKVTNSEAISRGEALKFVSGRLTKASVADTPAAIATHAVTAGTDKECEVIIITANQVYEVAYEGTKDASFIVGLATAELDTDGMALNAADATPAGAVSILKIDDTTKLCQVMFAKRQLN